MTRVPERLRGWGARDPVALADGTPFRDGMTVWTETGLRIDGAVTSRPNGKNTVLLVGGVAVATVGFCYPTSESVPLEWCI